MWLTISRSVPIMVRLVGPLLRQTEIGRLLARELRQLHADLVEMQRGDFFVEMLGQRVDLTLYWPCFVQSSICASVWLVNDADMTKEGCPVALPRFTSRPSDSRMMRLPSANSTSSTCGFTLCHLKFLQARDLDLGIEVADIADDGAVLHRAHVVDRDHVDIAGGGDENVGALGARRPSS